MCFLYRKNLRIYDVQSNTNGIWHHMRLDVLASNLRPIQNRKFYHQLRKHNPRTWKSDVTPESVKLSCLRKRLNNSPESFWLTKRQGLRTDSTLDWLQSKKKRKRHSQNGFCGRLPTAPRWPSNPCWADLQFCQPAICLLRELKIFIPEINATWSRWKEVAIRYHADASSNRIVCWFPINFSFDIDCVSEFLVIIRKLNSKEWRKMKAPLIGRSPFFLLQLRVH